MKKGHVTHIFDNHLSFLKEIYPKNGYPDNFTDRRFSRVIFSQCVNKNAPTGEKKDFLLVRPYLEVIPLQTRTKMAF